MVEKIYELKNQMLERFEQEVRERGIERMDITEAGKLADIVKDLAEAEACCWKAEYYRSVTNAMGGGSEQSRQSYQPAQQTGARQGYQVAHARVESATEGLRNAMMTASPDERERIRSEAMAIIGMR